MSKRAEFHIKNLVFPVMLMVSVGASAETLTGTAVGGVADGDTITVLDANREQHKIRLGGIDAPEKIQSGGQRGKEWLSALVFIGWRRAADTRRRTLPITHSEAQLPERLLHFKTCRTYASNSARGA